jgi:hypothetical protein
VFEEDQLRVDRRLFREWSDVAAYLEGTVKRIPFQHNTESQRERSCGEAEAYLLVTRLTRAPIGAERWLDSTAWVTKQKLAAMLLEFI